MSKNKQNNAEVVDSCTTRLKALKSYVANTKAVIAIDGVPHKASDVVAIYQDCLDARATLDTQRAEVKATLVTRATAESNRRAADRALKPWVINQFGANSTQAHDFGFQPPKAPVRTVSEKAHAVALGQATREARHTMGSKQKEDIKGTIVVPAAPAVPAMTVQAAAPAASTTNTTTTVNAAAAAPPPSPQPTVATPSNGAASPVNGVSVTNGSSPQH